MKKLMKKMISILLLVTVIFTSIGVIPVQANEADGNVQENDVDSESTYDIPVTAAQIRRMWCTTNYSTADYVYVDSFIGYARVLYTRFYSSELQSDVTDKVVLTFEGRTRHANENVAVAAIAITDSQALKVESSVNTAKSALKITTEKKANKSDKLMTTTAGNYADAVKNQVVAYGKATSQETAVSDNVFSNFVYPVTIELDVTDVVKAAMEKGDNVQFAILPAKDVMIQDGDGATVNIGKLEGFGEYKNGVVYSTEGEVLYENISAASLDTSKTVCGKAGYYDGSINETNDAYFHWIHPVKSGAKLTVWRQSDKDVFDAYVEGIANAQDFENSFTEISYLFEETLWADFKDVSGEPGIYEALYERIKDTDFESFKNRFVEVVSEYKNNDIYDIKATAVQLRRMWCQTDYNSGDYTYSNDFLGYGRSLYTRFYNKEMESGNAYRILLSFNGRTRTANETVSVAAVAIRDEQALTVESSVTGSDSALRTAPDKSTSTADKLMTNTSGYYNNAVKDSVVAYARATSEETPVTENILSNFVYPVTIELDVTDAVKQALKDGQNVQFALLPAKDIMIEDSNGTLINIGRLDAFAEYKNGTVYDANGEVLYDNVQTASLDTSKTVCGSADYYAANTLNTKDTYFDWVYPVVSTIKMTAWTKMHEEAFAEYAASVENPAAVKDSFETIAYLFDETLWAQFENVNEEDGIYDAIYAAMTSTDLAGFTAAFKQLVVDYYWGSYDLRVNAETDLGGARGTLKVDGADIPKLSYMKATVKDVDGNELKTEVLTVKSGTSYYNFYEVANAANVEFVLFADEGCTVQLSKALKVNVAKLNIPGVFITELSNQHVRTYVSAGESWGSDEQPFQYIELYNYTDTAVDLSEYTFVYNDHVGSHAFEWIKETNGSLILEPGEVYIIGVYSADSAALGYTYATEEELAAYWAGFNAFYSIDIPVTNRVMIACVASGDGAAMLDGINHLERSQDANVTVSAQIQKGDEIITKVNLFEKKASSSYAFHFVPSDGNGVEEKRLFVTGCHPGQLMAEQDVTYCEDVFLNGTDMLKVMSYNILATEKSASDNKTGLEIEEREDLFVGVIGEYQPDIVGLQEVNYRWAPLLHADMPGAGYSEIQGYSTNGHTYANASGVWDLLNPIYYKTDKFNLIESGAAYLTPDGKRTTQQWDTTNMKRTLTYVVLENKETGEIVNFINTHLVTKGKIARVEQVKLLCAKGAELLAKFGGGLVIVGDHNIFEGSEPYQVYVRSGVVEDSRYLTTNHTVISTTSSGGLSHDKEYGVPIDLVMVSPEKFFVNKYEVHVGAYPQGLLSDHSGVYVELYNRETEDNDIPVISGVEEGKSYYPSATFSVVEKYLDYVTVNGEPVAYASDSYSISEPGNYTVAAADMAGRQVSVSFTVAASGTVDEVEKLIDAIGQVTLENENKVTAARAAYEALNEDERAQVENYAVLTAAEAELIRLKEEKAAADQAAADVVANKIAAIGEVSLESKAAISEARAAYEGLTDEQKPLVANLDTLAAAEAKLKKIESTMNLFDKDSTDNWMKSLSYKGAKLTDEVKYANIFTTHKISVSTGDTLYWGSFSKEDYVMEVYGANDTYLGQVMFKNITSYDLGTTVVGVNDAVANQYLYEAAITFAGAEYVRILGNISTMDSYQVYKNVENGWAEILDKKIDDIGEVTLEKEPVIAEARLIYEALTQEQKDLVANYDALAAAEAALEVLKNPPVELAIVKQPVHAVAENGETAVVTVEAQGEGLTYKWYYKNPGNVKFYDSGSQFVSEDGASYIIPMYAWRDGQEVYCVVTDKNGESVQSNTVTITMDNGSIQILKQPESVVVDTLGEEAVVTVEATGTDLTYTWYYKNPGNVKFYASGTDFVSADGASYTIAVSKWRDGQEVYCVITDANGVTVQTETVMLSVAK